MNGWFPVSFELFLTILFVMEINLVNGQAHADTFQISNDRMPIRAKKAGASFKSGNWKTEELLNDIVAENPDFQTTLLPLLDNGANIRKPRMPIRARKAGASIKVTNNIDLENSGQISDKIVDFLTDSKSDLGNRNKERVQFPVEEYVDYSGERNCLHGTFWHIRGYRCVPIICLHLRDINTGECLQNSSSYWGGGRRYWFYKKHGQYRGRSYQTRKL